MGLLHAMLGEHWRSAHCLCFDQDLCDLFRSSSDCHCTLSRLSVQSSCFWCAIKHAACAVLLGVAAAIPTPCRLLPQLLKE